MSTTFVVHVVDTTAPMIAPHADVFVAATSASGATVSYASPATSDAVDGAGTAICSPASGTQFPIGNTTVTCNATDSHNNIAAPTSFVVHVVDTAAPVIDGHLDETVEATSASGAIANYTSPATSDAVDGPGVAICTPGSGTFFVFGDTTVTCNATDSNGNAATPTMFIVHVVDTTAPVIAVHADVTTEATSSSGASVSYSSPTTSDIVDGAGTASCSPASGSTFAIGNTTVTCSATDSHGNASTPTTFFVHVVDTTAPVIAAHANISVTTNNILGTIVTYSPSATSDTVDGAGTATCSPSSGSFFSVGDTLITCNATDA
ncbi:MAG: HYR domain-containing protein, partial [Anaerolineae bacterium]|nr:HYR domain-containing protein [Anaerolineae bacterium]